MVFAIVTSLYSHRQRPLLGTNVTTLTCNNSVFATCCVYSLLTNPGYTEVNRLISFPVRSGRVFMAKSSTFAVRTRLQRHKRLTLKQPDIRAASPTGRHAVEHFIEPLSCLAS